MRWWKQFVMKIVFARCDVVWRQTRQGRTGARVSSTGALQAAKGSARETAGLLRKAPASGTKVAAASATARDVVEHAAFERIREAGGPRVAQEE